MDKIIRISSKRANEIIDNFERKQQMKDQSDWGRYLIPPEENGDIYYTAIDNMSGDCWTEDFKSPEAAMAWLNGATLEDVKEAFPEERNNASLQAICDEPIEGEVMIAGTHVVVDPRLHDVSYNEAVNYIEFVSKKQERGSLVKELILAPESDNQISLDYTIKPPRFDRIRRITGYLVGDLDRWNSAKLAEYNDRCKHVHANAAVR